MIVNIFVHQWYLKFTFCAFGIVKTGTLRIINDYKVTNIILMRKISYKICIVQETLNMLNTPWIKFANQLSVTL